MIGSLRAGSRDLSGGDQREGDRPPRVAVRHDAMRRAAKDVSRVHEPSTGDHAHVAPAAVSRHAFLEIHPSGVVDVPVFGVHLSAVHAAWTERRA